MKRSLILAASLAVGAMAPRAHALERVRFIVVDPVTRERIVGARVVIEDLHLAHAPARLSAGFLQSRPTDTFDLKQWTTAESQDGVTTVILPLDTPIILQNQEPPVKDIYIKVTASRITVKPTDTSGSSTRSKEEISKFVNTAGGDTKKLTKGQSGVAEDSAGQQHVRGEHTDITYVVDGVPLPDTLSGRQGSVVVPSTIQQLEIITGGFAPEFGGQTAAVLNIATLPSAKKLDMDATLQFGNYGTVNGDFTGVGPIGRKGSFVINVGATRSNNAFEPQQPDNQTAHNRSEDLNLFGKVRLGVSPRDSLTLTASQNPGRTQNSNRTGLPDAFADVGQGYGFLGLRNRDGTRPDAGNGGMGSDPVLLPSQEDAGQDIFLKEVSEFATLNWIHRLGSADTLQLSVTGLHSGQDVRNNNPAVDLLNLPIDNSIEYNPTASRNVHHLQFEGSYAARRSKHAYKVGFLLDLQSGRESYSITPASRLALNALAALDTRLVPEGSFETDENGDPVLDVNGNQVYTPTGNVTPTLGVKRSGYYGAAYAQDTWNLGSNLTLNYGLRADWYHQVQEPGTPVTAFLLSPRINASYGIDKKTVLRGSYNRLFNTPPLAQGAFVGLPIQPETLDQYDLSIERNTGPGQTLKAAYYMKDIRNQVDVGLLIPGSQIGLYSAVTLAQGGVHGVELSYEVSGYKGWDGYLNYTLSAAKPNGTDNTGEDVEEFNDHDQRHTLGAGIAYTWKSGASVAGVLSFGSGLASSTVGDSARTARFEMDLRFSTGDRLFKGRGGLGIDIENVFDSRRVINFQSAFSGTRFQQGRRILISGNVKF